MRCLPPPPQVWNLAPNPAHYDAIVVMMRLRESLRNYVAEINAVAAESGLPMVRPMFLQFPLDAECQLPATEDQFMFGPSWLVAPVTVYQAKTRSVYLPALDANHTWVYYFNQTSVGRNGGRFDVPTPLGEFPLFYVLPVLPPVPPMAAVAAV